MKKQIKEYEFNFYNIGYDDYSTILELAKKGKKYFLNLYIDKVTTRQIDIISSLVRLFYRDENITLIFYLSHSSGLSYPDIFDAYQIEMIKQSRHMFMKKE